MDLHIFGVPALPQVVRGADVGALIADVVRRGARGVEPGDVFVVAQKIVSKAEGAVVRLDEVVPSAIATRWGSETGKDPRVVEVILRESRRIVRMDRGILISETRHGFVCANAGVDASNVAPGFVTVLPDDPDASADRLRGALSAAFGCPVAVIVSDTFGRAWREGAVNVALGVSGLTPLLDYRGTADSHGRPLTSTVIALADELAAAAEIVTRKSAGTPVAIVRGAAEWAGDGHGRMLVRDASRDLFR
ncbi:MAG: F420-dependent oxidoreductase [Acidobacteria bacterium]|nr:F420-dependent oxidoreductase [Acidobacteriota bacterium]